MTDQGISPLHRRMLEDMAIRKLAPKTHRDHVQRSRTSRRGARLSAVSGVERRRHNRGLQSGPRSMPFNSSAYADTAFCAEG